MLFNFVNHWWLAYFITLLSFNLCPGVSFVATVKNTIENKSFKIGMFTALGVASADFLASVIGFFFCSTLDAHPLMFKYARMIGMMYLMYVGVKFMTLNRKTLSTNGSSVSNNKIEAYKSGFLYNFSNIGMITITISVVSQYYKYISTWYGYVNLILTVPFVSFCYFTTIAFCCNFLSLWKFFDKHVSLLDRIAGFVIIIIASTNIKSIIGQ